MLQNIKQISSRLWNIDENGKTTTSINDHNRVCEEAKNDLPYNYIRQQWY